MNAPHDKPRDAFEAANLPAFDDRVPARAAAADELSRRGLLVVGHGTRDRAGVAEFHEAVRLISAQATANGRSSPRVEGCFLELAEPAIEAAVERLATAGVERVTIAPLILFAAGHAKRDIPDAVAAAARRCSIIVERQLPHLGCRPELIALSARRYREATHRLDPIAAGETLLLMVGRGSRDDEATAEMRNFARLRTEVTPVGRLEVAFTAMAEPGLEQAIADVSRLPFRRIVVQPHLLFAGKLLDRVRATVERAAATYDDRHWIVAGHLGPEPELAAAVLANLTRL